MYNLLKKSSGIKLELALSYMIERQAEMWQCNHSIYIKHLVFTIWVFMCFFWREAQWSSGVSVCSAQSKHKWSNGGPILPTAHDNTWQITIIFSLGGYKLTMRALRIKKKKEKLQNTHDSEIDFSLRIHILFVFCYYCEYYESSRNQI